MRAYPSDRAADAMYAGLKADYVFLTHALSDLRHRLSTILHKAEHANGEGGLGWNHFSLLPRGSVITQTALQGGADLDVDLIVPRELAFWRIQSIADLAKSDEGCIELWKAFEEKIQMLWTAIVKPTVAAAALLDRTVSAPGFSAKVGQTAASCTRSIALVTSINGTPIDVDLFVKFTDERGNVWAPTVKKVGAGPARRWESVPYSQPMVSSKNWNDEHHLAVLLVKLWKVKHKTQISERIDPLEQIPLRSADQHAELASLKVELEAAGFPKGYHLNFAMNSLAARELPRTERAVHKGLVLSKVIGYVQRLGAFLSQAYDPNLGRGTQFNMQGAEGRPSQPCQKDTQVNYSYLDENSTSLRLSLNPLQNNILSRLSKLQSLVPRWKREALSCERSRVFDSALMEDAGFFSVSQLRCLEGAWVDDIPTFDDFDVPWRAVFGDGSGVAPLVSFSHRLRNTFHSTKHTVYAHNENTCEYEETPLKQFLADHGGKRSFEWIDEKNRQQFAHVDLPGLLGERTKMMKRRALLFSDDTVGLLNTALVWLLPMADEFGVDETMRPFIVLQEVQAEKHWPDTYERTKSLMAHIVIQMVGVATEAMNNCVAQLSQRIQNGYPLEEDKSLQMLPGGLAGILVPLRLDPAASFLSPNPPVTHPVYADIDDSI